MLRYRIYGLIVLFVLWGCATPSPARYDAAVRSELREATIIIYGDSRPEIPLAVWENGADERASVVKRIVDASPDAILHSGDLVYMGASDGEWGRFDREHASLREARIPFYAVLGNHEYVGGNHDALKNFFSRFPLLEGRMWYGLRMGPVMFLMLNSNFSQLTDDEVQAQDRWLEEQLLEARGRDDIRGIILVCHHPPYTNAILHSRSREVEHHFVSRLHGHPKVKAFFAGHVHSYERFFIDGVHHVVSGGGGAPLASIQQDPRKMTFRDLCPTQDRRYNFCLGRLKGEKLSFEVFNLGRDGTWSTMDAFDIDLK